MAQAKKKFKQDVLTSHLLPRTNDCAGRNPSNDNAASSVTKIVSEGLSASSPSASMSTLNDSKPFTSQASTSSSRCNILVASSSEQQHSLILTTTTAKTTLTTIPLQPLGPFPLNDKRRRFRADWYKKYKWLEYNNQLDPAFCYPCRQLMQRNVIISSYTDDAFTTTGFRS